jgi:hypothetical protein
MKTKEQKESQLTIIGDPFTLASMKGEWASLPIIIIFGHRYACHQKELLYQGVGGGRCY